MKAQYTTKDDRNTAIRECKEIWREIKASGLSKEKFLALHPMHKVNSYKKHCPLCEISFHTVRRNSDSHLVCKECCPTCPLVIQYGVASRNLKCFNLGYREGFFDDNKNPYPDRWYKAIENLKEE